MPKSKPSYLLHKPTGQARCRIDGKDHYLGQYGSPKSREKYDDLVAEWLVNNSDLRRYTLTVDELSLQYLTHADGYYVKNGTPTGEANNIRLALRHVIRLFGTTRARDFSPRNLKSVRDAMIQAGWCRTNINRHVSRVKSMFRWAIAEEFVPPTVLTALEAVAGLRRGRSNAIESKPVKPVPESTLKAIHPHVSRQVWAMMQIQQLTGARPGEVLIMRGCDIDRSGKIWEYIPASHKTEHHGKGRVIFIGPKAQGILRKFLKADPQKPLFSPRDGRAEYVRANYRDGATKCHRGKRAPGTTYTIYTYGRAIHRACAKANVDKFGPNRLRHNAATTLRREAGIETARAVLGHSSAFTTEIYAEADAEKARAIVAKIG